MKRRRSSRRRNTPSLLTLAVGLSVACVLVAGGAGFESASFSTATAPRSAAADVTIDDTGAHGLDATQSVHVNSTEALVNVTNHLGRDVTVVVALRDNSTQIGDLVVEGTNEGDTATFTLREKKTETVKIDVPGDSSLVGETVYFHVNATESGLDVNAPDRSAPVDG